LQAESLLSGANTEELAATYERLARIHGRQGAFDNCRAAAGKALAIRERFSAQRPSDPDAAVNLAIARPIAGECVYLAGSDFNEVLNRYYLPSLSTLDPWKGCHDLARVQDILGIAQRHTAYALWKLGDYRSAADFTRGGYEAAERAAAAAAPGKFSLEWILVGAYTDHCLSLVHTGDIPNGIVYHDRSLHGLRRLRALEPDNHELHRGIADTLMRLGQARAGLDPATAMRNYEEALAIHLQLIEANPTSMENVRNVVETRSGVAALSDRRKRLVSIGKTSSSSAAPGIREISRRNSGFCSKN
jgi:tetratricopeptide (TPR) repeat protein